jgi:hypothetical protein
MNNFSINELPYDTLSLLGMTKEKVLKLDKENLLRLLSGKRTDILRFDFYADGKHFMADGKLLLERKDTVIKACVVPVRRQIQNDYGLSNAELIKLYAGKLINKNIEGQRYILQLDRETNEIIRAKTNGINIPFDMAAKEREKLLQGKSVMIETAAGNRSVRLDLINSKGFAVDGERQPIRYTGAYFTETDLKAANIQNYNLAEQDIQRLLDGYKTGLTDLQNGIKGKMALERNEDKTVSLQLFPVKNEIDNDILLDARQIEKLQKGETVAANAGGKMYLCQLDRETNDLLRRQPEHVIPDKIRDIELKAEDKDRLANGQSIFLLNKETGEPITAKLDLNHKQGIEIKDDILTLKTLYAAGENANEILLNTIPNKIQRDKFLTRNNLDKNDLSNTARAAFDEKQKYYFDYHNPGVMSYILTDANRMEYMLFNQANSQEAAVKIKM